MNPFASIRKALDRFRKPTNKTLYVVGVISNPQRYKSRPSLYKKFMQHMAQTPGVTLITVEQAFGDRPFEVTSAANKNHVQLRAGPESELWVKESLINIGCAHLTKTYPDWRYFAWVDGDLSFVRSDWAQETVEALQHYRVVQPWSQCLDMGPNSELIGTAHSLASCYHKYPMSHAPRGKYGTPFWHPGYAWAMRRETYEQLGGLIDWCCLGAGDNHMAWAFLGNIKMAISGEIKNSAYMRRAFAYQELCTKFVKRDLGFVQGTLVHGWHGKKRERFYVERWKVLVENNFDPDLHLVTNADGLVVLRHDVPIKFRDALRLYFRSRREDSIDLD